MTPADDTLFAALGAPWFTAGRDGAARLAVYEAGPRGAAAPPVVLLHGFPEIAYSWRAQFAALAAAGRRVLAPDQRGYGRSEAPAQVEAYAMRRLAGDLVAMLDEAGIERAVWVGHDWGGAVAWAMPLLHPERTAGVVGVNTPFTPRPDRDPLEGLRARYGPDMYILFFQEEGPAETLFEADVERTLRWFHRRPAAAASAFGAGGGASTDGSLAIQKGLARYDPATDTAALLGPEELAVHVGAYRRTGFRGGLNWYRNLSRSWRESEGLPQNVAHPALMICAELDAVLPPRLAERMGRWIGDLETHVIAGCGHWTQAEKPRELNRLLLDWLDRRFPRP